MLYRRSRLKGGSFFFTVVTYRRKKILHQEAASLILDAFSMVGSRLPFTTDAFVILPDHIHCIWTLPEGDRDFSTRWRQIKGHFTRNCGQSLKGLRTASMHQKGEQAVWQRRFWEHTIRDEEDLVRHMDYIHYNPVKHGLAASPMDWPHSSFQSYVRQGVYATDWGTGRKIEFDPGVGHE